MYTIAKWAADPKHATLIKNVKIYSLLFIRIAGVLLGWFMFLGFTYGLVFEIHPLRSWVIPLISATLFCLSYVAVRRFDRGFRTAYLFRSVGLVAPWIWLAWIVFACFRFFFFIAYAQIFSIPEKPPNHFQQYAGLPYGWIATMLLTYVYAPVSEELTFRGLIQGGIERRCTPLVAIVSTAALFAILHLDGELVVPHFFGGLVYGYAVFATRSVWAGVILHVGHNVLIDALSKLFGSLVISMSISVTTSITVILLLILIWCSFKLWKTRSLDKAGQES